MAEAERTVTTPHGTYRDTSTGECSSSCDFFLDCDQSIEYDNCFYPGGDCPLAKEVDRGDD